MKMKKFNTLILSLSFLITFCACEGEKGENNTSSVNRTETIRKSHNNEKQKITHIWIDSDLSVGMQEASGRYSDVDDGYALYQLLKSDMVKIHGISAVFGNTSLENAFKLCKKMSIEFSTENIPVYKGAPEAIDLNHSDTNQAVEAMADALKEMSLTIVALGPGTDVGLLLLNYPHLKDSIEEVILVAGRRDETAYFSIGNKGKRFGDANFDKDPISFHVIFQNGVPVTLCPFEISHKVWIKEDDLNQLADADKGAQWLAQHSRPWLTQWKKQGEDGFNPFDVLASHYILYPADIISEELNARIEIHQNDTRPTDENAYKYYLICDNNHGFPVTYCYDVVPGFHEKLMNTLLK